MEYVYLDYTSHIKQIDALWCATFGDPPEFAAELLGTFVRGHAADGSCILAAFDGGRLVSQLALTAFELPGRAAPGRCFYLYGAATDPGYRGRGIMGELIAMAQARARKCGMAGIFLMPAEESLFGYYARFGYAACGGVWKLTGTCPAAAPLCGFGDGTQPRLYDIYHDFLKHRPCGFQPLKDREFFDFTLRAYLDEGGHCLTTRDGYALYRLEDGKLCVDECFADPATILAHLYTQYRPVSWEICGPYAFSLHTAAQYTPTAMFLPLDGGTVVDAKAYVNLFLNI